MLLSAEPCLVLCCDAHPLPPYAGVMRLACSAVGRAIGAGRAAASDARRSVSDGEHRIPRPLTKSVSEPHSILVRVFLGVIGGRSRLLAPALLPNRKRRFFSPRSRMKEPRTMALETAAAARISREATRDRNCWLA